MKKLISIFLVLAMLLTLAPMNILAADEIGEADYLDEIYNLSPEEYAEWKQNYISSQALSLMAEDGRFLYSSLNHGYIRNEYIEAFINESGHYTMGTIEGNPDSSTDNNKLLLFGHPGSSTTETLIRIDGRDYFFNSNNSIFSSDGTKCVSTMTIDDVLITQTISLQHNTYTQRADVAEIKYELKNNSSEAKELGGRIMLDTMLGNNDGAPFKIPGIGNVTTECQYVGDQIPQYWQSFDNFESPTVVSSGTFYKALSQRPDKVQFAHWGYIFGSSWDFMVNTDRYVTGDSAVAAYYNPKTIASGETRIFATYYGLSDLSEIETIGEVNFRLTGAVSELSPNDEGTAYADNPFTLTAYIQNNNSTAKSVEVKLNIPSELVVNTATTKTISVGANAEGNVSWEIWAKPQSTRKTVNYSVSISADGQEKTDNRTIVLPAVSYYDVSSLSLSKTHLTMQKGKSERLIAYLDTQSGRQEAKKYEVRWSSSNPSVVSVDANGNVTAKKAGTATIKAYTADYKKYKTCAVTVRTRPTTELDLLCLSHLVYKNLDSQVSNKKKISDFIDSKYTTEKFFNGTITLNEYYKSNLGEFKVEGTARNSSQGFYAASFLDCNDGIIIAYRGSHELFDPLDNLGAWWNDWAETNAMMGMGALPKQFDSALDFYNEVKNRPENEGKKIYLTGHSLGGALATFVSIVTGEEAVTFNGAGGFILDNTYYIFSRALNNFNGIDNWNFKNHYNTEDTKVGAIKADIYHTVRNYDNGHFSSAHNIFSFLTTDSSGRISLPRNSTENHWYSYTPWIQELDIGGRELEDKLNLGGIPGYLIKTKIPTLGVGRVFLGTESNSIKTMTAPQNLFELRENVFFSAGGSTMTGNGSSPDTFIFKNRDMMYGKGGDDTYITYETGEFFAEVVDSSGDDVIVFKNLDMSQLSVTHNRGEDFYRLSTNTGGAMWVSKRFWSEIRIVDKNGVTRKISELGSNARMFSLMSASEPTESKVTTLFIEGKNINLDILDLEKNVLGTYSNANSEVFTTEYAYVYTSNAEGTENIEIELLDSNLYVRVNDGENVKLSALYGAVDEANSEVFTANIDLVSNEAALIDGNSESTNKFVYINGDVETAISVEELAKVSAIIPTLASDVSTFALRTATVDNIDIYAGETVNIELTFEPENVAIDDVKVELLEENDIVSVSTSDNKIIVRGKSAGTNTLKITALDGSETTISIPVTVRQDLIEDAVLTSNGSEYVENTWSNYPVVIAATVPEGYDTLVYEVEGDVYQNVDSITVDSEGETLVRVYAKNNESGRITDTKSYELKIDLSAPVFDGIEDEGVYYIDKLIDATDVNLDTISVNGTEFTADEYINGKWINVAGNYTIVATDLSGKSTEAVIEFKVLPEPEELTIGDEELIVNIRNAFEDVKYDLDEERRELLDSTIYELENRISYLENPDNASNSIVAFSIEGQIGEAYINEDLSTIQIEVAPAALEAEKTAIISISDGATISPKPYVAQDFSNAVTYTVTAANGTERTWTVTASLPTDSTAPQILDGSAVNNTITIEFDDHIGSITNEAGFTLTKQTGSITNNTISNISYYENIVNVEFNTPFDEMEMGEYSLSIASNSLSNISSVGNEDDSYTFTLGSVEKVATPSANKSGQVTSGTQVTLSTATEGATIYYTVDGTEPTSSSTVYSSPITITSALTLKAIAIKGGMLDSDVMTETYTISSGGSNTGGGGGGGTPSYKITVTQGENGTISPSSTSVTQNGNKTFTIVANEGYEIEDVIVDGKSVGAVTSYTFEEVTKAATITAKFKKIEETKGIWENSFNDVKENDWFYEAVKFASEKGITSGVSENKFAPNDKVTRGQFITMLCRAYGIKEMTGDNFADCGNTWYTGYLAAAKQLGISNGVGNNKFAPEKEITREEMVTLIYNYLKSIDKVDIENKETSFRDKDSISDWAKAGVAFASKKGYVNGKENNLFDPNGDATRAELAQIFFNMFK